MTASSTTLRDVRAAYYRFVIAACLPGTGLRGIGDATDGSGLGTDPGDLDASRAPVTRMIRAGSGDGPWRPVVGTLVLRAGPATYGRHWRVEPIENEAGGVSGFLDLGPTRETARIALDAATVAVHATRDALTVHGVAYPQVVSQ